MKLLIPLFVLSLLSSCTDKTIAELDFLVGTWKRENVEQFEVWEKKSAHKLIGYSYRIKENQKSITETLAIKKVGDQFVFEATVPDQNEGRTVKFMLNAEIDSIFSFENDKHDFPKKIQYKNLSDNRVKVDVLGDEDSGFSYIQVRQ